MGQILNNNAEIARAFREMAHDFDGVGEKWNTRLEQARQADGGSSGPDGGSGLDAAKASAERDVARGFAADFLDAIQSIQREGDAKRDRDRQILIELSGVSCRAGRLAIKVIDRLELPARLHVEAEAINDSDDTAVYSFWWNEIASSMTGKPMQVGGTQPVSPATQCEYGSRVCNRIAEMLEGDPVPVTRPDLSVKGLVNAGLGSRTSILKAADAAGVERAKHGQHGFKFSAADVYRIGLERGDPSKSRLSKDQRSKWNDFLVKIGQPTLDMPRKATKKAPG